MSPPSPVVADKARLYGLLTRKRQRVLFSGGSVRMETRRGKLLVDTDDTALESLEDVTVRRGWFANSLSVRTASGEVFKISGLDRDQTQRVREAILHAVEERAAAVAQAVLDAEETLQRLLRQDSYIRHSAAVPTYEKIASTVQRDGGLIRRHLDAAAAEALDRLEDVKSPESFDAARVRANQRIVSDRVADVEVTVNTVLNACVTREQAEAIATDEDVTSVLAGAGTGKTTVIVGKVAHLVHNERVDPARILVLAFNRKARREIVDRLTGELTGVDVETFHAFGLRVVADIEAAPSISKTATDDHVMRAAIDEILKELIEDDKTSKMVADYLTYHFEPCYSPFDFTTDEEYEAHCRHVELRTLSEDLVKSLEELRIANFLTEHGVDFEYESKYPHATATREYRQYLPDFFLPDHGVYIEHFALDEQGNSPPHWSDYSEGVDWKRRIHRQYGTTLIETYSWEHKRGVWQSTLRDKLEERGVVLTPIPRRYLFDLLSETKLSQLSGLLATCLNHAKTSNADFDVLRARARARGRAQRHHLHRDLAFLDIFDRVHQRYEQLLTEADELDFHDLINRAARHMRHNRWVSPYLYVLVDEFQDISAGRMELLKALHSLETAYFVVGDDWQSIYRFTGSDVNLVRDCKSHLGHTQQRTLSRTFRYADGILDPSTEFIKRNPEQTQRPLHSASTARNDGITVIAADDMASGVRSALQDIASIATGESPDILVLGRYNKSREAISVGVKFATVHQAKGTEADYTIVVDLIDERWGFPSQINDDPILELLLPPSHGEALPFAEERRLFYVALTRARNGAYLVTDLRFPSAFVQELLEQSHSIRRIGGLAPALPCTRCRNGRLVISQSHKTLRCINHPRCAHQAPRCDNCKTGYAVVDSNSTVTCTNPGCDQPPEICPSCKLGVIVQRRSSRTGTFQACTEYWSEIKCTYTRNTAKNTRHDSSRR